MYFRRLNGRRVLILSYYPVGELEIGFQLAGEPNDAFVKCSLEQVRDFALDAMARHDYTPLVLDVLIEKP